MLINPVVVIAAAAIVLCVFIFCIINKPAKPLFTGTSIVMLIVFLIFTAVINISLSSSSGDSGHSQRCQCRNRLFNRAVQPNLHTAGAVVPDFCVHRHRADTDLCSFYDHRSPAHFFHYKQPVKTRKTKAERFYEDKKTAVSCQAGYSRCSGFF